MGGQSRTQKRTPETLALLLKYHYDDDMTWEQCAEKLHVHWKTVFNWRHTPDFAEATKIFFGNLDAEALPEALAHLLRILRNRESNPRLRFEAASRVLTVYKGARHIVEGDIGIEVILRRALNGDGNGQPD